MNDLYLHFFEYIGPFNWASGNTVATNGTSGNQMQQKLQSRIKFKMQCNGVNKKCNNKK